VANGSVLKTMHANPAPRKELQTYRQHPNHQSSLHSMSSHCYPAVPHVARTDDGFRVLRENYHDEIESRRSVCPGNAIDRMERVFLIECQSGR
jgi:hypothetical protein